MFPQRYFTGRMFAPRYFPKVGAEGAPIVEFDFGDTSVEFPPRRTVAFEDARTVVFEPRRTVRFDQ
jgi:hypothetical protein